MYERPRGTHSDSLQGGGLPPLYLDLPRTLARGAKVNFDAIWRHEIGKTLAPFDEHDGRAVENFVQTEGCNLCGRVQAIQIDVIDAHSLTVVAHNGLCRAACVSKRSVFVN